MKNKNNGRQKRGLLAWVIAAMPLGFATSALAAPTTYEFSTGPVSGAFNLFAGTPNQALFDALNGLTLTGTFTYDSEVPFTSTTNGPLVFGQSNYDGAISNLAGGLGAFQFAGTGTFAVGAVANEGYMPFPGFLPADFFQITEGASGFTLSGAGLSLVNARLFWIESTDYGDGPTPDFLLDNTLPAAPPGFAGRVALDFISPNAAPNDFSSLASAFFDGARVKPVAVPEPNTLALFAMAALMLIAIARLPRRQRNR